MSYDELRKDNPCKGLSFFKKSYEVGQSLVEAMIALGVAVIVIVALVNLSLVSLRSSTIARNQLTAKNLANQGLEMVRSLRDQDWDNLPAAGSYYLPAPLNQTKEEITVENLTFTRKIYIADIDEKKQVTCEVTWSDSSGQKQVSISTYLTNWRQ